MISGRIKSAFNIARSTTRVLIDARNEMIQSSFHTVKELASLYKDAGVKTFRIGREVYKETMNQSSKNRKIIVKTSGAAFKQTINILKDYNVSERTSKNTKDQTLSIDDLLK